MLRVKNGSLFEPLFAYPIVDKGKGGCLFWRGFFRRLQTLFVLFALLFTILGGRMVYIQLLQGPKLSAMGSKIHSQFIPGEAIPRGDILDRNGVS